MNDDDTPTGPDAKVPLAYRGGAGRVIAAGSRRAATGRRAGPWAHAALGAVGLVAVVPFLWMLATSLKTADGANAFPPQWWPRPLTVAAYREVLASPKVDFLLWTRNTLVVELLVVTGTTLSSAVVAYGFAKVRFRGRRVLFVVMLATMMVPFPVTMVSLFTIFRWLGDHTGVPFLGTFKPLWVPAWFASAFNVFLLRQFFLTIPDELSEAARIDGCGDVGHLLPRHPPADQARPDGRRPVRLPGHLERLPRPPDLPPAARAVHPRPGPGQPAEPTGRHVLAHPDGRQRAGRAAGADAVLPGPADVRRRDRHDGHEGVTGPPRPPGRSRPHLGSGPKQLPSCSRPEPASDTRAG